VTTAHERRPRKKESVEPKHAQEAPAKGQMKRTLADAPCGARLKALLSSGNFGGFILKQRLDAHASIQILAVSRFGDGTSA